MILYWVAWVALRLYFLFVLRVRVEGMDNVPRSGPFVLCSNHVSWQDPLLLGAILPRKLFYMAKTELFTSPLAARVLRAVGAFPVRRHHADRRALRTALDLLGGGSAVAVFPEGTRSRDGTVGRAEPGAALLAVSSGARVVPVAIAGVYRRGGLTLRFGPAFHLALSGPVRPSAVELRTLAEREIMGAVRALLRARRAAVGPA